MITDLRRSKREVDYLPILVHAVDGIQGEVLAGPFSSRIIDISSHGACLLMTQVMRDTFHVFHSTREKDSHQLQLSITIPPEVKNPIIITAIPVWLDLFRKNEISAFKMGVEFMVSPEGKQMKKLQKAMQLQQKKRGSWWTRNSKPVGKKG